MKNPLVLLSFFLMLLLSFNTINGENTHLFFGFQENTEIWDITDIKGNAAKTVLLSSEQALEGPNSLKVEMEFPGEGCIEKDFFKDLSIYSCLILNIYLPEEKTPEDMSIAVLLQDNELLWYQTQKFSLVKGIWNRLTLDVKHGSSFWESIGHNQPWSEKPASGIRKISLKFFSEKKTSAKIYIDAVMGDISAFPDYSTNTDSVQICEKFEISFYLNRKIKNPFDRKEVRVEGIFTCPEGSRLVVPGFYYQSYAGKLEKGRELLTPEGYPCWKIRFTPIKEGVYKYYVQITHDKETFFSKENNFAAIPSEKSGFVKTSAVDGRYFVFDNGAFFYPIGLNVRSPTDTRYTAMMKQKTADADSGTFYYQKMFSRMSENGMNFAEIWMAPWFAALEWTENRPGYRGLGYYNLMNAYKLDRIIESAEKNNIFIQLVIINHGQLSTWCDEEWQDNPYNIENGGFLKSPDEFFTDAKAKELFKNQLRYIAARWGYSSRIFSWEVINEINLIGAKRNFYRDGQQAIAEWYREMTFFLKETDAFNHLVTAHYTILADNHILSEIIDYTITNAYYDTKRTSLTAFLDKIYEHHSRFDKPAFVSEYGGTSGGAAAENLKRDIIAGLWYSYHKHFAASPLFWWHRFVKEYGLFDIYKIFSEYSSDTDRINNAFESMEAEIEGPGKKQLFAEAFGTSYFASCWIYDFAVTKGMGNASFPEMNNLELTIKNKKNGKYNVFFYDMEKGFIEQREITTVSGNLVVQLPSFYKWIAVKAELYEQI